MAIISIPSSIGGVSIPGLTNVPGGPLGVLFGNPNILNSYHYPRDLGSATKGHAIKFTIREVQPIDYGTQNKQTALGNAIQNFSKGNGSIEDATAAFSETATNVKEFFKGVTNSDSVSESYNILLNERKTKIAAVINLYMPDTMAFQYAVDYGNPISLVKTAGDVAGGVLDTVTKGAASKGIESVIGSDARGSDATRLVLATQGLALNPQEQILFNGIDFRTFSLSFTFTPYSREEAQAVKDIIKQFRLYAAPQIKKGTAGMFFIPPGVFDLEFQFNGVKNKNVTQVAQSVIQDIDVNYAPNGWATHSDGAPVQTTLTMTFKEIQLIDRTKIQEGY
jgi:hypothetical protein